MIKLEYPVNIVAQCLVGGGICAMIGKSETMLGKSICSDKRKIRGRQAERGEEQAHMIDIHAHILDHIDDGSESRSMSLAMLRLSAASGVVDIIATPHVNRQGLIPPWHTIKEKIWALRRDAAFEGIPLRIHAGAEIELNGDVLRFLQAGSHDYCLAGTSYVLLELTNQTPLDLAAQMLYTLQLRGFSPILAHIERYARLFAEPDRLFDWLKRGVLYQCNAGSFTGEFGPELQKRVQDLYRNRLIHFLGSDGHRTAFRTTDMRAARAELLRLAKKEKPHEDLWQLAAQNGEAMLRGRVLYPPVPAHWQDKPRGLLRRFLPI